MANVELLKKVRDKITSDPEHWNQNFWGILDGEVVERTRKPLADRTPEFEISCGTTACIAGWACILSGEPMEWRTAAPDYFQPRLLSATETVHGRDVSVRAAELLGLDEIDAGDLFHTYDHDEALERLNHLIEHGNLDTFYMEG
jgi:hypothetical protein